MIPIPIITPSTEQRLWSRVKPNADTECWEWLALKDKDGYGRFYIGKKNLLAHRVAYAAYYKIDPGNLLVCHRCDNPSCVNPAHLWLGSNADNLADMKNKGRSHSCRGERGSRTVLTPSDVYQIRELVSSGLTHRQAGRAVGIGKSQVGRIMRGEQWAHI